MDAALYQRLDIPRLTTNLGKPETVNKMLMLFLDAVRKTLDELEKAEKENSIEQWLAITHRLKGSSQNITAKRMVALCVEAEEIRELPHSAAKPTLYHMFKEYGLLREMIEKHLAENARSSLL